MIAFLQLYIRTRSTSLQDTGEAGKAAARDWQQCSAAGAGRPARLHSSRPASITAGPRVTSAESGRRPSRKSGDETMIESQFKNNRSLLDSSVGPPHNSLFQPNQNSYTYAVMGPWRGPRLPYIRAGPVRDQIYTRNLQNTQ